MTRTLDDIITAAHRLDNRLLGTEVMADDIQSALAELCEGWTEEEQQSVLRLAWEFAQTIGEADEQVRTVDDEDLSRSWEVHYLFVARRLAIHLGRIVDDWIEEDWQHSYHERHVLYPLD